MSLIASPRAAGAYPNLRGSNTADYLKTGTIVLSAVGKPGIPYLAMDNATVYAVANYPALVNALQPGNVVFNGVYAATQVALANLDTSASLTQMVAKAPNSIALSDGNWNTAGNQQSWSTDAGATWHEQIPSAQWGATMVTTINKAIELASGRVIVLDQSTNVATKRFDALGTFTQNAAAGSSTVCTDIDYDGTSTCVVASFVNASAVLKKSTDNGQTFAVGTITAPNGALTTQVTNICWTGQYWIAQQNNLWYRSTDLVTWSASIAAITLTSTNCSIASDRAGHVIIVNAGNFQVSNDHGATWSASAAITGYTAQTVTSISPACYLLHDGAGNFIYPRGNVYSKDNGATWQALPSIAFTGNITGQQVLRGYGAWVKRTDGVIFYGPGRTQFQLVPPGDYVSKLPSTYWIKGY